MWNTSCRTVRHTGTKEQKLEVEHVLQDCPTHQNLIRAETWPVDYIPLREKISGPLSQKPGLPTTHRCGRKSSAPSNRNLACWHTAEGENLRTQATESWLADDYMPLREKIFGPCQQKPGLPTTHRCGRKSSAPVNRNLACWLHIWGRRSSAPSNRNLACWHTAEGENLRPQATETWLADYIPLKEKIVGPKQQKPGLLTTRLWGRRSSAPCHVYSVQQHSSGNPELLSER